MAEPKKKLSKTRTHRRRAQYTVQTTTVTRCSHCSEIIRTHQVCPHCGYYKARLVAVKRPAKLDEKSAAQTPKP